MYTIIYPDNAMLVVTCTCFDSVYQTPILTTRATKALFDRDDNFRHYHHEHYMLEGIIPQSLILRIMPQRDLAVFEIITSY